MTIIRCEYNNEIWDLDVLNEQPIRVDVSAIENDAIGEVFGASSQQFTLPGSRKNNRFFKHAYKVGVSGVPGLGESVRASVITNSNTLLEGSLYLEEVVRTEIDGINYNVVIVNDVVSFNESIKTVAVKDLNWNAFTHSLSVENITSSWDGNLLGGAVFYPLIDQGRDGQETTGSLPNVAIDSADTASLGYINNSLTPLKVQQLTPAIQVSALLDRIFEEGAFSYSSSLEPLFDQLYILPKQTEDLSVNGSGFGGYRFNATKTSTDQGFTDGDGYITASINNETLDEGNAYNTTTYTYTVPTTGTYRFTGSFVVELDPSDPNPQFRGRIRNITSGFTLASKLHEPQTIESTFTVDTNDVNVFANDQIQLQIDYIQGGGPGALESKLLEGSTFGAITTPRNYETGIVELGQQFDPQTKCIDILKGLIEKFNLVIEPVYTQNKVLKIESYNNWIQSGDTKDWTLKVENAKRIGLRHPLSSQPKTLVFEDNKDNDKLSKQVIDGADGYQWGTEIIDAVSDVPQGERKVGSFFAPIILEGIPGSTDSLIPQLYKTDDTQVERKTFKFKPRLGYKVNGTLDATAFIGSSAEPFQSYATISNYNQLPITSSLTKNLHYNDNLYPPTFLTGSIPTKNAYVEYWESYIEDLYEDDNRILNLDLEFQPEELKDIALNDRIFVEDTLYRINKINGYNLVNPDVVNVELIKIKPTGQVIPLNCNFDFTAVDTTTTSTTTSPTTTTTTSTTAVPIQNWISYPCDGTGNAYIVRGSLVFGQAFFHNQSSEAYYALQVTEDETTAVITSALFPDCNSTGTTTTTTTTQALANTFYTNWGPSPGAGAANSGTACNTSLPNTGLERFYIYDRTTVPQIQVGDQIYLDASGTTILTSSFNPWYAIDIVDNGQNTDYVIQVNGTNGQVLDIFNCTGTTTTTQAPALLDVYARLLAGTESTTIYYTINGGSQQTLFSGVLDTNCDLIVNDLSLVPGDQIVIYTDENEFIAGQPGVTCPSSVGSSTTYTDTLSVGPNEINLTINTQLPTTTTTSTTTVPQVTQIYSDSQPGSAGLDSCGCELETTIYNYQVLGNNVDITQDMTGKTIYSNYNTNELFFGDDLWYCIATASLVTPEISIRINSVGIVTDWAQSVPCTTTTTTTIPPASLVVYGRSELGNDNVELLYSVNQGSGTSFYQGPLSTSCTELDTLTGFEESDVITIYEGTSDFITANNSQANCPSTAQSSTAVNITLAAGVNYISLCVDTGYTTTTVAPTTTTTTTTTLAQTQIWSDATPGNGNLEDCGCSAEVGVFNYQVLGANVDITQDMTGKTIYEDIDTNTLFFGDDKWYCITDNNGGTTLYSIQINNVGIVTDWTLSPNCTTTTTTSTTTLDPNGCYEWQLECLTPGGCLVEYTDCYGTPQSFTAEFEVPGLICGKPTPSITGGVVEFAGNCATTTSTTTTTTTTTAAPTTTTTTTTTYNCVSCDEYQIENYSQVPGDTLTIQYVDCDTKLYTEALIPYDSSGYVCSCITPVRISGPTSIAITNIGECGGTTTTTTTSTTTQAPLVDWDGVGEYATSTLACDEGSQLIPTGYKHNGSGTYPTLLDYVYESNGTTPLTAGWYYVSFEGTAIEVETGGRVIDKIICGGPI